MNEPVDPSAPGTTPSAPAPTPPGEAPTPPPALEAAPLDTVTPAPAKTGAGRAVLFGVSAGIAVVVIAAAAAWFLLRPKNHELGGT